MSERGAKSLLFDEVFELCEALEKRTRESGKSDPELMRICRGMRAICYALDHPSSWLVQHYKTALAKEVLAAMECTGEGGSP